VSAAPLRQFRKLLAFALRHSARDMARNRARTAFALVCVATGVAAVVALRTLGFMVGDALTTNLAAVNRGDIRVYASTGVPELVELTDLRYAVFNAATVRNLREWAFQERVAITFARLLQPGQVTAVDAPGADSRAVLLLFVEPDLYPFYDPITLQNPPGAPLASAFAAGAGGGAHPVVVAAGLADPEAGLGLAVGDRVRVGGSEAAFVVRGVAERDAETLLTLPQTAFLDYVYLPLSDLPLIGEAPLPDQAFVRVPLGRDIAAVQSSLIAYLQAHSHTTKNIERELNIASVPELEKENAEAADIIDDLILVMGLASLLIGGIGIINTMLVVVSRRTVEIAVLKTLGLKAGRVTFLFLVEALLMGLLGSVIGAALGVVISYLIRGVGEEALGIALAWRVYPAALTSGVALGVVVTGLFGFLPTLIAGQVRPAVVLRPNEAQLPTVGLLQTLLTLTVMIVALGLLVDSIVFEEIHVGPRTMLAGGGALAGLFAGIILANTQLGRPLPVGYQFRLARRFERLETWLIRAAGGVKRGRANLTRIVRGSRQAALAYGAAAVGAASASFLMLLTAEVWRPFGIGRVKPAGNLITAIHQDEWGWVIAWLALTLAVGLLIRLKARPLVALIALGSIGITLGGALGWALGGALERLLGGTFVWRALDGVSTGIVLSEGALAALGVVYALYWLLVWATARLPLLIVSGAIGLVLLSVLIAVVAVAYLGGGMALGALWRARGAPAGEPQAAEATEAAGGAVGRRNFARLLAALAGMAVCVLAFELAGASAAAGGLLAALVIWIALWVALRRRHRVDARLIVREMAGRRVRVASTLLGLSVGIAGLSVVSLTTSAATRMLQVQLGESAEGNLLVVAWNQAQGAQVRDKLGAVEGVQRISQFTTYNGTLLRVNDRRVELPRHPGVGPGEARENSSFERSNVGLDLMLSERADLASLPDYDMKSGRSLEPGDEGQHRILLRDSFLVNELGIKTGDRLLFRFYNGLTQADDVYLMLHVVGVVSLQSKRTGLEDIGNGLIVPPGTLSEEGVKPQNVITLALVDKSDPSAMRRAKRAVTNVRGGVLAVEISALTEFLQNLLNQLKAIPTLVAWLALMAGTAIIANTVALAAQERRREIGVMKAVGLKGWRVLGLLMLENGLIGLMAGIIGAGAGFLITVIMVLAAHSPSDLKNAIVFSTMGWLVLMSIGVAMGAAALSAWSAASEKPMNVLRYE